MRKSLIPALAIGGLVAAACSSSASTTGTETFAGSSTSVTSNIVPLTASGIVADHGTINLGGNGTKGTLDLAKGHVDVTHTNPSPPFSLDKTTCTGTSVASGTYTITGGTGSYAKATGHGTYKVTFTGKFPLVGGKCNPSPNATPTSGLTTFHASGPFTFG